MKCLVFLLLSLFLAGAAVGPPGFEWQRRLTGAVSVARQTSDGGYLVAGSRNDKHWIQRLDINGNFLWQRLNGSPGGFEDSVVDVQETLDGGFVALIEADPSTNGFGQVDCEVMRLDASGGVLWDRVFGASAEEYPAQIRLISDGGFVFGGHFMAGTNGNRTSTNYGGSDWWWVRLDSNGNKIAERSFGGSGSDVFITLTLTTDGGFALVGKSSSMASGNKTSPHHGFGDIWVVRLDANGAKLWDKSFGGDAEDYPINVWETNGVLVVGGFSRSFASGNKTNAISGTWIIGLNAQGDKLWERAVTNLTSSIIPAGDGGFLLGNSVQVVTNYCCDLYFHVQRIGPQAERTWELGYRANTSLRTLQRTRDGGLIMGGGVHLLRTVPDALNAPPRLETGFIGGQGYYLTLRGSSNTDYALERSSNLFSWQPIATNRLLGNQTQAVNQASSDENQVYHRARVVR